MLTQHATFGDVTVLTPIGRIDHTNSEAFRAALAPHVERSLAEGGRLVIDLSRVDYISSAGLHTFLLAAKQARSGGATIVVAALRPVVKEIFEISRFTLLFEVFNDVDAALRTLSTAAARAYESARQGL